MKKNNFLLIGLLCFVFLSGCTESERQDKSTKNDDGPQITLDSSMVIEHTETKKMEEHDENLSIEQVDEE
jgi:hypothetical protein